MDGCILGKFSFQPKAFWFSKKNSLEFSKRTMCILVGADGQPFFGHYAGEQARLGGGGPNNSAHCLWTFHHLRPPAPWVFWNSTACCIVVDFFFLFQNYLKIWGVFLPCLPHWDMHHEWTRQWLDSNLSEVMRIWLFFLLFQDEFIECVRTCGHLSR